MLGTQMVVFSLAEAYFYSEGYPQSILPLKPNMDKPLHVAQPCQTVQHQHTDSTPPSPLYQVFLTTPCRNWVSCRKLNNAEIYPLCCHSIHYIQP